MAVLPRRKNYPQIPATHFVPPTQSLSTLHIFPAAHLGQAPPQSTSVSVPFFTVSVHVGAAHDFVPPLHTPVVQSAPELHFLFTPHVGPQTPPQSISDSVEFMDPSKQLTQTLFAHVP